MGFSMSTAPRNILTTLHNKEMKLLITFSEDLCNEVLVLHKES